MAALRVDQHRIDAVRIDLPLPPGAHVLGAAGAVAALALLEHEALDAAGARLLAQRRQRGPVGRVDERRDLQRPATGVRDHALQALAALPLRLLAHVGARQLQQVVREEGHGLFGEDLPGHRLAADALLQLGERLHAAVAPDDDLAVQHAGVGQARVHRVELGEAAVEQVLAARPQPGLRAAPDELRADTVPFPLDLPVGARAQRFDRRLQRVREEERVGLARFGGRVHGLRVDEQRVARGVGRVELVGVAHHALRQQLGVDAGRLGQRAQHQVARDAHAKRAADQLGQQEAAGGVELAPVAFQRDRHGVWRLAAQREQALLDPHVQRQVHRLARRRQHVGDGLGQVADDVVALVEQPLGDAGGLARGRAQQAGGHGLARLAAGQEVQRPGRVGGPCALEVGEQGVGLLLGRRRRVERGEQGGELLHDGAATAASSAGLASSSSPYSVLNAPDSRPCSARKRTSGST